MHIDREPHVRRVAAGGGRAAVIALAACALAIGGVTNAAASGSQPTSSATSTATSGSAQGLPAGGISLNVYPPSSIGGAGQPVSFTERVTNTRTTSLPMSRLFLDIQAQEGSADWMTLRAQTQQGTWTTLPLTFTQLAGSVDYATQLPYDFTLRPGESITFHLALGMPMGWPGHGSTNGWDDHVTLVSSVANPSGEGTGWAQQHTIIPVTAPTSALEGVPTTAVAGGTPISFTAVVRNPTPSRYTDLDYWLHVTGHATVQVRQGNGAWTTVRAIPNQPPDGNGVIVRLLGTSDNTVEPGTALSRQVRVFLPKGSPLGTTELTDCVDINEDTANLLGTVMCQHEVSVKVTAASPTGTSVGTGASAPGTTLAHTGADNTGTIIGSALALLGLGTLLTALAARRRRTSQH